MSTTDTTLRPVARRTRREWFAQAADGYLAALAGVHRAPLDTTALGSWTLRDLLGHASRAFSTIETYLAAEPPAGAPHLETTGDYLRAMIDTSDGGDRTSASAVAERGREAGRTLGDDPVAATRAIAQRVRALVDATDDGAIVATPWGTMRLGDYLGTRAFELTVHGMDVARATGLRVPDDLDACAGEAIGLALETASTDERAAALLALAGRQPLPPRFSMVP